MSDHIDMLESFVSQLYRSRHDTLGAVRLDKFKKSTDNDLSLLPPSKEALRQHIYRALRWVCKRTVCRRTRYS